MSSPTQPQHTPKAVSAPGKVLLAGGYLVLDRAYSGLVFGLDARIHVAIEPIRTKSGVSLSEIIVRSPQFLDAIWEYGYRLTEGGGGIVVYGLRASHDSKQSKNPFIETALTYALTYISSLLPNTPIAPSSISILADESYYSNPGTPLSPTSPFKSYPLPLTSAHKTGLGSSAALVTSFTAALLSYYLPPSLFTLSSPESQRILHNLAQAAHCAAQGKVGSGFDIASAVYGSCLYRRFSPAILEHLPAPGAEGFAARLSDVVQGEWDVSVGKEVVRMPEGLRLVMCDVDCGSQTPGMVRKVLAWREGDRGEADRVWAGLQRANEGFAEELGRLAEGKGERGYERLSEVIGEVRALVREMGDKSGVPIEPPQQTKLLDACAEVKGVVGGVVPGAGGYDAVVLLLEDRDEVVADLKKVLDGWKGDDAGGEGVKIGKVGILGVRQDMVGVRSEDLTLYKGWVDL
ncbi:unnamed protein product [Periconia digitata]|uniref:Phosphomevalonate kinase n=1 Tax=Periconia digitata TaxID=1303443 RepID=A0A9W4XPA8_9PLEO|nr:unnamed protein product [Periconia digitata]